MECRRTDLLKTPMSVLAGLRRYVGTFRTFALAGRNAAKAIEVEPGVNGSPAKARTQQASPWHKHDEAGESAEAAHQSRTFSDWNDATPGFFEADLVAHCGGRVDGPFVNSLVITDIASGWTEFVPLLRKSDADVIAGLDAIRSVLPMPLVGLDTDNGCEFIINQLLDYCERNCATFTRSRAYKKNDQAHIEQKNGSIIRRIVGYDRYEGVDSVSALLKLYPVLRLYVNFFQS
jgi:hypothetical protein